MCLNIEIDETINRLALVFISKNIYSMPVSLDDSFQGDPEESALYILELLDYLDRLLVKYGVETNCNHKKHTYFDRFKDLYLENVDEGYLYIIPLRK